MNIRSVASNDIRERRLCVMRTRLKLRYRRWHCILTASDVTADCHVIQSVASATGSQQSTVTIESLIGSPPRAVSFANGTLTSITDRVTNYFGSNVVLAREVNVFYCVRQYIGNFCMRCTYEWVNECLPLQPCSLCKTISFSKLLIA